MKKTNLLNLLFLAVLCLGFTSCSNDDDDEHVKEESIVGTWVFLKEDTKVDFKTNNPEFTQPFTDFFVDEALYPKEELTLKEDSTFILISTIDNPETYQGSYSYQDGMLTMMFDGEVEDKYNEYSVYTIEMLDDTLAMEINYADMDTYPLDWWIQYTIRENENFKDLDPASIKVEKMVVQMVGYRQ